MRSRLLAGPGGLADYEILEMLLFLGIPRRDTKPLAKALINRFGDLAATLDASAAALREAGLTEPALAALALSGESAALLARPEAQELPQLNDWTALDLHLGLSAGRLAGLHAVLLDTWNRLVAQPDWPTDVEPDHFIREMLALALDRHAAAVILVRDRPGAAARALAADRALLAGAQAAAASLSIVVHDLVVTGRGGWTSLRQG